MSMDIAEPLATNAGPIAAGLTTGVVTLLGVLITRGTMRGSSRTQRTDDYRREVRSAASSVVRATRTFADAIKAFERSIFWIRGAVHTIPSYDERYLACQKGKAELNEKLADFELLIDIDALSRVAFMVTVYSTMANVATFNVSFRSQRSDYTETQLEEELKQVHKYRKDLEKRVLPKFVESVKKYAPIPS